MPSPARAMPYTLREASGASCDSTLTTPAPMSARYMPAVGPAMRWASSRTRTPSRGGGSGRVMAATTYHRILGGGFAPLPSSIAGSAPAAASDQRSRELRPQDEDDA